ncbi:hypothetical protein L1987_14355 [Smallanthus sonchifolius]|uniref:Uncharacterized protein n=1 Tax=Smallanthus sonchifolius TaxID=185202 RepID=A0ACB9J4R9_9ASTR|nr:hypothetical protein L1987_14355 [Smallanthus sonchifolius]
MAREDRTVANILKSIQDRLQRLALTVRPQQGHRLTPLQSVNKVAPYARTFSNPKSNTPFPKPAVTAAHKFITLDESEVFENPWDVIKSKDEASPDRDHEPKDIGLDECEFLVDFEVSSNIHFDEEPETPEIDEEVLELEDGACLVARRTPWFNQINAQITSLECVVVSAKVFQATNKRAQPTTESEPNFMWVLPPRLSPFVDNEAEGYVAKYLMGKIDMFDQRGPKVGGIKDTTKISSSLRWRFVLQKLICRLLLIARVALAFSMSGDRSVAFLEHVITTFASVVLLPAQELLSGRCKIGYQELAQTCHEAYSHKILEEEMSRASDCLVASYGESGEHFRSHLAYHSIPSLEIVPPVTNSILRNRQ